MSSTEPTHTTPDATAAPTGAVMVVGGGIAGMQASLDLAEAGFKVYLVEAKSAIGGHMAQLDKTFPTNDCAMCNLSPKLVDVGRHLNIEILTLRQAKNALCTLLGLPPHNLDGMLGNRSAIPQAPLEVAVGILADLLRRRPDIRLAELQGAAQCALIGVATADLYPAFTLTGTFGFLSSDVGRFSLADIASWNSRTGSFRPAFTWNVLNYGQITNAVRVQDARFQELIFGYQDTVLRAQQEVEDGLAIFLQSQKRLVSLEAAAAEAKRSADLALIQYREGATDYTTVLTAQASLLNLLFVLPSP